MKTLYINISNEQVQSNDELEVLNYDLDSDFFFYLGAKIGKGCDVDNENALVTDFNTQDNEEDYKQIIVQWNEIKAILFRKECQKEFKFTLPDCYIHWLKFHPQYVAVYDKKFSHGESAVIMIDLEELYEDSVEDLRREILLKLQRDDLYRGIDEIVFNDDAATRKSPIVRIIKDKYEGIGFKSYKKWLQKNEKKPTQLVPYKIQNDNFLLKVNKKVLTFKIEEVSFDMVYVEGGEFIMGSDKMKHQVALSSFYIGRTQVTNALWNVVMNNWCKGNEDPVHSVTWFDCKNFIDKLNYVLKAQLGTAQFHIPTEAQWEYAARGGKESKGYKYSGSDTLDEVACYDDIIGPCSVGQKKANELGLYDMSGNVWEWCNDWYYSDYHMMPQIDPTGPKKGQSLVIRGGSWNSNAVLCLSTSRAYRRPGSKDDNLGLRLVLSYY